MIKDSKDKLCIIARHDGNRPKKSWYVVQVDWNETSMADAESRGRYHVCWYIRHYKDAEEMKVSECRFWPEIHQVRADGELGPMKVVRPGKCSPAMLKRMKSEWYQQEINLFNECIVGPFDFTTIDKHTHRIGDAVWEELRRRANPDEVEVSLLDCVAPLPMWKRGG